MAVGLRQSLQAAIQRSSTSANYASAGNDPSVGNVYMSTSVNSGYPSAGGFFNSLFGGFGTSAAQPMGPPLGQAMPPSQHGCLAPPHAAARCFHDGNGIEEKDREIERLKRELRKSDEKANFFRSQVMALQQQVTNMNPQPVMSAGAGGQSDEVQRLRADLAEERAAKSQLEARVRELQQLLQPGACAFSSATAGSGQLGMGGAWASNGGMMPTPSSPSRGLRAVREGDPLDPGANFGGPRRALIIGCDYPNQTGTLRAGVSDAQQWARFFMKRCDLTEQDIRLLTDDQSQYGKQGSTSLIATKSNILRGLQWLVAKASAGDQLFFVFCGHGAQVVIEEYAGQKMCENACVPTDVGADGGQVPRVVSDTDVHKALLQLPSSVQATLIYDSCHAGQPLDRTGLNYLTEYVSRGRVDYDKLKGHPVLPRFLELQSWKVRPQPAEAVRESTLRCQVVQWAACSNAQFCVELPIDERPRGVFTYIFIHALLKVGVNAVSEGILREMQNETARLKGRWRLMQDVKMTLSHSTTVRQPFLR